MNLDKNKILQSIGTKPMNFFEISSANDLPRSTNRDLNTVLFELMKEGLIDRTRDNSYYRFEFIKKNFQGSLFKHRDGFGFIEFEQGKSAFVPAFRIAEMMNGDVVEANIAKDPRNPEKYIAIIIKTISRGLIYIVGNLELFENKFILKPLDKNLTQEIFVINADKKYLNHRVKVKINRYGKNNLDTTFVESFGDKSDPTSIIDGIVGGTGIQITFSAKTMEEASKIPASVEKIPSNAKDLRNLLTVTIDGESTKDFDDAVSVERVENKGYKLYVHIADVAHYVKENTSLDTDAFERGNSVYLVDRTIPMLPSRLSDGICSLNPHVDRLTLTAEMDIDKSGNTTSFALYRSIINSDHRLTYNQVNDFLASKITFDKELADMTIVAQELSKILGVKKHNAGYIDLEIEEAKVILDDKNKPIDVKVVKRGLSEVMIENFMVRANESVAEYMTSKKFPCVYRVHDTPSPAKFEALKSVLKTLEIDLDFHFTKNPKVFAQNVSKLKEVRFDSFIKMMLLRTMEKAVYSDENIGHFGLASKFYSHFTSPIRRYSDLILHRMIHTFVFDHDEQARQHFTNILSTICLHISETEKIAMDLERKVADVKKAEFMEGFINKQMKGQIVSILKFGFFVEFENSVNGLVRFEESKDALIEFGKLGNEVKFNNHLLKVGDFVDVIISSVDPEMGQIGLTLVKNESGS